MSRRFTLVIPSLGPGGAQRVLTLMANHWAQAGDVVTLITLDAAPAAFKLNANVRRISLDVARQSHNPLQAVWNNWGRVRRLRAAIAESQPDHVISFIDQTNVLTLLAYARLQKGVIVSERTDPRHHNIGRVWSMLRRRTYPRAQAIVVQTAAAKAVIARLAPHTPIHVIPNPALECPADEVARPESSMGVDQSTRIAPESANQPAAPRPSPKLRACHPGNDGNRPKRVVAVGRLGSEKGFDLLIEAFARIAAAHPDWTLEILGEGPARGELEALIKSKKLNDRITLRGWVDAPERELARFDLFVLSSRYEGFPNALLEAMSHGLPVISFDCESGPAEIIRHEQDGLLIPAGDVAALSESMARLMSDTGERQRLGHNAREVTQRFSAEQFFRKWEAVLEGRSDEGHDALAEK